MSEKSINNRVIEIFEILKENNLVKNESDFAKKIGYSPAGVNFVMKGERNAGLKMLKAIMETFNVNFNYLYSGEGSKYLNGGPLLRLNTVVGEKNYTDIRGRKNMYVIPLKAFGGFLSGYADTVYLETLEKESFPWIKGECFQFEIEGNSMYITKVIDGIEYSYGYCPKSHVVSTAVEAFTDLIKERDYVFVTIDGIIVKRFVKIEDNRCHLKCINKEYDPVKPIYLKNIKKVFFVEKKVQDQ